MSKNFELLQQSHEEDLFCTSGHAPEPRVTVVRQAVPVQGEHSPQEVWKGASLPLQWLNRIKQGIQNWRQVQLLANRNEPDVAAVTRAEEMKLVQQVFHTANGQRPQVVLFSGVEANVGCAVICAHVSEILAAEPEASVCLVDADFRSPSLHRHLGVENGKGLADALLQDGPIQDFTQCVPGGKLWVLPSGPVNARHGVALAPERLQARMTELRSVFERVVIHSSPLSLDADPLSLGRWTDGVVLVVEAHSTRREAARRVKENLKIANIRVLGVVLSNRTFPIPAAVYRRL